MFFLIMHYSVLEFKEGTWDHLIPLIRVNYMLVNAISCMHTTEKWKVGRE